MQESLPHPSQVKRSALAEKDYQIGRVVALSRDNHIHQILPSQVDLTFAYEKSSVSLKCELQDPGVRSSGVLLKQSVKTSGESRVEVNDLRAC